MRQVTPDIARTGECIETYPLHDFDKMIKDFRRLERFMKRKSRRELVYTRIRAWGLPDSEDTWQIFLLP